jgi:hypothetical protein
MLPWCSVIFIRAPDARSQRTILSLNVESAGGRSVMQVECQQEGLAHALALLSGHHLGIPEHKLHMSICSALYQLPCSVYKCTNESSSKLQEPLKRTGSCFSGVAASPTSVNPKTLDLKRLHRLKVVHQQTSKFFPFIAISA